MRAGDADGLAELFGRAIVRDETASPASRHIAIDGKTLRGSKDENGDAAHCLSAFARALHKVLDHTASRGKGMEIADALKLLEKIDLTDKVVTGDAMFCQKNLTEKIENAGAR